MPRLAFNESITTGALTGVSNASVTGAAVLVNSPSGLRARDLSAYIILTAATASLTVTPYWQVSNDNVTFKTLNRTPNTAADLPIVTGTANSTVVVPPPRGVEGFRWARAMLLIAGATGAAGDLYSIGYNYSQDVQ